MMIKVAVDAMGGDYAPVQTVAGAVEAVNANKEIRVLLVGQEQMISDELAKYTFNKDQIQIVNATEVIETEEPPVNAIRKKKDSSIVVGMNLVKQKEADAFVSAGSSGAILVGGQVIVGRIKGVERPPLAPLIPTEKGVSLLIDCGANVDARPSHLVQFARMGSLYMEHVVGIKNPTVAIVNIGAEEEKGGAEDGLCRRHADDPRAGLLGALERECGFAAGAASPRSLFLCGLRANPLFSSRFARRPAFAERL